MGIKSQIERSINRARREGRTADAAKLERELGSHIISFVGKKNRKGNSETPHRNFFHRPVVNELTFAAIMTVVIFATQNLGVFPSSWFAVLTLLAISRPLRIVPLDNPVRIRKAVIFILVIAGAFFGYTIFVARSTDGLLPYGVITVAGLLFLSSRPATGYVREFVSETASYARPLGRLKAMILLLVSANLTLACIFWAIAVYQPSSFEPGLQSFSEALLYSAQVTTVVGGTTSIPRNALAQVLTAVGILGGAVLLILMVAFAFNLPEVREAGAKGGTRVAGAKRK